MSAHIEALIQRQLERDLLRELIEDAEAEHGPVDRVAVETKRAILRGDMAGARPASSSPLPTCTATSTPSTPSWPPLCAGESAGEGESRARGRPPVVGPLVR